VRKKDGRVVAWCLQCDGLKALRKSANHSQPFVTPHTA
jgi:hypothetical protein